MHYSQNSLELLSRDSIVAVWIFNALKAGLLCIYGPDKLHQLHQWTMKYWRQGLNSFFNEYGLLLYPWQPNKDILFINLMNHELSWVQLVLKKAQGYHTGHQLSSKVINWSTIVLVFRVIAKGRKASSIILILKDDAWHITVILSCSNEVVCIFWRYQWIFCQRKDQDRPRCFGGVWDETCIFQKSSELFVRIKVWVDQWLNRVISSVDSITLART